MVRNGSHPSLAYIADIDSNGSLNLTLIEFFEENNETFIQLSQTPIYSNSHYFGVIGKVSQISPEDMPLYDLLWPYLTNKRVMAIFGPYYTMADTSIDNTIEGCRGEDCSGMSSVKPSLEGESLNFSEMTTTPVKPIPPKLRYLVLISVNKSIIQYVFLNVSKI